jgi:hypothetical protein
MIPAPQLAAAVTSAAGAVVDAMGPFASARVVKNFAERPVDAAALYGPATDRLGRIVESWDPHGMIRVGHPIPVASV